MKLDVHGVGLSCGWMGVALVAMAACGSGEPPGAPEVVLAEGKEAWWEQPGTDPFWFEGGKDPKPATLVGCEELEALAPGYATIRAPSLRAEDHFHATIGDCDIAMTWASWWPSQVVQKQLARMPGCAGCELDGLLDGFVFGESTLHLRLLRREGRVIATFDERSRPSPEEIVFAEVPVRVRRADGSRQVVVLRSDCADGSFARRCLRLDDSTMDPEASP